VQFGRPFAGSARPAARPHNGWNRIDEWEELGGVVGVGGREADGQRDAVPIDNQVVFGAGLATVGRVGTGGCAPLLARTLRLSALARDQSTVASSPSRFSSMVCSFSQTPAACQSRRRRQQVTPLPQPNSFGSSRHGQPVRKTKTMPPRAARSGTRGRPPLGLGGSLGSSGSMAAQRSSGTSGGLFMGEMMPCLGGSETRS
jgi:hypothetical protein